MAVNTLPPPPINDKPGSYTWLEWYRQLRAYVSTSGSVPWYIINFAGSNITDIAVRNHADLQSMQGGTAGEHYHLTSAQHAALSAGPHNNMSGIQGGTAGQYYHLNADQYAAISNELDVELRTSGTVLPITPTVFAPAAATVVATSGIVYNIGNGQFTFTNGGVYTMSLTLNASASAGNRKVYFYAELDTGGGFNILRYSARSREIVPSVEDQVLFTATLKIPKGAKTRHYIWASTNTVTLNSTDVPGTTAGTVTLPAFRVQWTGSL